MHYLFGCTCFATKYSKKTDWSATGDRNFMILCSARALQRQKSSAAQMQHRTSGPELFVSNQQYHVWTAKVHTSLQCKYDRNTKIDLDDTKSYNTAEVVFKRESLISVLKYKNKR